MFSMGLYRRQDNFNDGRNVYEYDNIYLYWNVDNVMGNVGAVSHKFF